MIIIIICYKSHDLNFFFAKKEVHIIWQKHLKLENLPLKFRCVLYTGVCYMPEYMVYVIFGKYQTCSKTIMIASET